MIEKQTPQEEDIILNPEILNQRIPRTSEKKEEKFKPSSKFINKGLKIQVNFETMGRFSIPPTIYFKDFSVEDVGNFSMCKPENVLENIVVSLNRLKDENTTVDLEEMTQSEFIEALIGIKAQFNSSKHEHSWLCDCQDDMEDNDKKINKDIIDLNNLNYKSILEVDNALKAEFKEDLEAFSEADYKSYLKQRYEEEATEEFCKMWTKDKEINSIKFTEPFYKLAEDGTLYGFRMIRIKDLLEAQKTLELKYQIEIKKIQKQNDNQESLAESKIKKQIKIEELKQQEYKEVLFYAKALSLVSVNNEPIEDSQQKIAIYKSLDKELLFDLEDFFNKINCGVHHEYTATCSFCGKTSRRLLHDEIIPFEFIPIKSDSEKRKKESYRRLIYFGK